jgi:hypothetical protein
MKQRLTSLGILLAMVAAPLVASAGDEAPIATTQSAGDCEKARARNKACVIEFGEPEKVDGDVATGLGENIAIPVKVVFSNLIRIRTDFRDYILKTAEDLP